MLQAAGLEVVRNETGGILDKETMKAMLADCDGVIVGVDPMDAEVIAAAPKLKAIAKYGVGVDNIDLDAAKARDIKVSRTVGANSEAVADYAMALILAVGGGAKGPVWCQMMANVYNARIKVPALLEEATSMGAAVTGGVGVGVFKDFTAIDQMLEIRQTIEPDPAAVAAYQPVKETFELCYQSLLPVYEHMAAQK